MAADRDEPEADVSEQRESVTDISVEHPFEALEDLGERPEADTLEQAVPVDEEQVLNPAPSPAEASEADWIEQSIVVPLNEDEEREPTGGHGGTAPT